jgi:hypothetical protein
MAEVSKSGIECFNTEITNAISDMSNIEDDAAETNAPATTSEPIKPTILFTSAEEPNEEFSDSAPQMESSLTDSTQQSSGWSMWYPIVLLMSFFCGCAACASYASEFFSDVFTKILRLIRSTGLMILPFISNLMQAEKSAASCSTAQYKPYFRFFGGTYIQYGVWTAIIILFIAVLLQCGMAASVDSQNHLNASRSLLTGQRISPQMSHGAAQSLLDYKQGNWLFSYQLDDLEVHTATLPTEDRDFSLDWCLDSGASCHFCNDSTKFMSRKKCNFSVVSFVGFCSCRKPRI